MLYHIIIFRYILNKAKMRTDQEMQKITKVSNDKIQFKSAKKLNEKAKIRKLKQLHQL